MVYEEPAARTRFTPGDRMDVRKSPDQSKRLVVSNILGPSAGRRLPSSSLPLRLNATADGGPHGVLNAQVEDEAAVEWRRAKLFANFDAKAKAAWSLEFEADALAAQSECRFLQAEIHRLLAQRAAEQVSTGKTIAQLEETVAWLQAEREKERAHVQDARLNVEVATGQLLEGYDTKLFQLEADRSDLSEKVYQLEMEIKNLHAGHLEDIQAHRSWHVECLNHMLEVTSGCNFLACVSFRAWRNLLQQKAAACQRRSLCHRTALAFCETSRMRLKRAFWRAWCSAWEQVQQQRRSQQVLLRAMTSWDRQAPEVLRRSSFLAWRLQTFSPTKAFAWQTIEKARQRAATAPEKELLRSYWHLWTARMQEAALQQNADLRETALQQQLERCQHDASAARVAHEELLAQHVAEAREEAKALQLTFQETKLQAEEAASQRLADEKLESAKLESRLTAAAEREKELRAEVARLADLLTAAEYDSLQKASDFTTSQERWGNELEEMRRECEEAVSLQLDLQRQEATAAGRLARVTQRAAEQEEELSELRVSLQAERAALLVLRAELPKSEARGKSLPAMSPLGSSTLDEVTKRWRLEHSHSVSAIYKSGSLPECLPVSGKLRVSGL
ncbi:unnamed protein product [Durusdinium trenchii]|uniref:Protein of centriole 5 n=2 Tax=Durusdinium trenchii TaxID=1381693 RepID=A0ABP0P0E9_9DINO